MKHTTYVAALLALIAGTTASADPRVLRSTSERYSDNGAKPSTGRAGSAKLEARALLNNDGTTDLEVTTGSLDSSATATGTMAKLQIKLLNSAGEAISTRNLNDLNNTYYKESLQALGRQQVIQVQAGVRGADPKRTGVVTVKTSVARRPDLAVVALNMPTQAIPGADVAIIADVSEINHDVGASAQCVLEIDGVASGSIPIWVDAGDTVSCEFHKNFTQLGKRSIVVKVTGAKPADADASNNAKTAEIEIGAKNSMSSYAYVDFYNGTQQYYSLHKVTDSGTGALLHEEKRSESWAYDNSYFGVSGWVDEYADIATASLSYSIKADGVSIGAGQVLGDVPPQSGSYNDGYWFNTWACKQAYTNIDDRGVISMQVFGSSICATTWGYVGGMSWAQTSGHYARGGGKIVYAVDNSCNSQITSCWWMANTSDIFSVESPKLPKANAYQLSLTIHTPAKTLSAHHDVQLTNAPNSWNYPLSCYESSDWYQARSYYSCSQQSGSYEHAHGYSIVTPAN